MSRQHPHRTDVVVGLVLASGAPVELSADGILALLGLATLGAAVGGWMVVYHHVLCRTEGMSPALALPGVVAGAFIMPGLVALHLVLGPRVGVLVVAVLTVWAVGTAVQSADARGAGRGADSNLTA